MSPRLLHGEPNTWISTDPKKHVEIFTAANKLHNGNLKPVIKMLKQWNKNISFNFNSFHIEVMALKIFNNVTISDFPSGIRYFFDNARSVVARQISDPAGYSHDVGAYISTQAQIDTAVSNMNTAYSRALKAEEFARANKIPAAVDEWIKIFGNKFPAYG